MSNGGSAVSETAEGIVSKPHKFSPQPDKPSLCASCNKNRGSGPHKSASDSAEAESFGDTMQALRRQVREDLGRRTYLVDASPEWVVYESYDESTDEYKLNRRSYSIADGAVTLADDPTEVLRTTVYVPVAKQEAAAGLVEIWGASFATENLADQSSSAHHKVVTAVHGTPASDVDHAFTQDEGGNPRWCSSCGRSNRHPVHG